jgi:hypothetical protein
MCVPISKVCFFLNLITTNTVMYPESSVEFTSIKLHWYLSCYMCTDGQTESVRGMGHGCLAKLMGLCYLISLSTYQEVIELWMCVEYF